MNMNENKRESKRQQGSGRGWTRGNKKGNRESCGGLWLIDLGLVCLKELMMALISEVQRIICSK